MGKDDIQPIMRFWYFIPYYSRAIRNPLLYQNVIIVLGY